MTLMVTLDFKDTHDALSLSRSYLQIFSYAFLQADRLKRRLKLLHVTPDLCLSVMFMGSKSYSSLGAKELQSVSEEVDT